MKRGILFTWPGTNILAFVSPFDTSDCSLLELFFDGGLEELLLDEGVWALCGAWCSNKRRYSG
jgi:hypothetical protein